MRSVITGIDIGSSVFQADESVKALTSEEHGGVSFGFNLDYLMSQARKLMTRLYSALKNAFRLTIFSNYTMSGRDAYYYGGQYFKLPKRVISRHSAFLVYHKRYHDSLKQSKAAGKHS